MTLAHQDISERLVDYLFGELDESARAAFDEHLAACESCRATVEATAKARAMAREVARAPLDEPVPLGVRSRVLAAAAAAAEERRTAASTTTVAAAAAAAIAAAGEPPTPGRSGAAAKSGADDRERRRAESPRRGWFDWLPGRWAFPTLATVAAMAAFFLVRGTILREARQPLGDTPAEKLGLPSAGPASGAAPAAQAPAVGVTEKILPQGKAETGRGIEADLQVGGERSRRKIGASSSSASGAAAAADSIGLAKPNRGRVADAQEGALHLPKPTVAKPAARKEDNPGRAMRRERAAEKAKLDDLAPSSAPEEPLGSATPPVPVPAAAPSGGSAALAARPSLEAASPEPPPASPGPAGEPPASERHADKKVKESKESKGSRDSRQSNDAKTRAADEAPAAESAQSDEEARAAPSRVERAPAPAVRRAPATSAAGSATAASDPARALAQRADQLLAKRRWTEASAAYRDLLRRFPDHPSATQWRARLAASDRAAATSGFATPPPPR